MAQHTPGPWDYDMGDLTIYQLETADTVAEVFSDRPRDEQEANARLMAAAPVLLAALRTAFTSAVWRHPSQCECEVCEEVRAAIVKAEDAA